MLGRVRGVNGAWVVAGLVLIVYGAWLVADFWSGHDPRDFVLVTTNPFAKCHESSLIHQDPNYRYSPGGYDGTFYYFIATDPYHARCYIDNPPYRYSRILYPLTARIAALGEPGLVPWTLILVNLFAIAGGALAVAMWLRRRGFSPWLGLIYGFYPGLFTSLWRDLTEPLSYGLCALAVYMFDYGSKRRLFWAGLCFGLAALGRETAVLFSVAYVAGVLLRKEWRRALILGGLSFLPLAVWKLWLELWMGSTGIFQPDYIPFHGLLSYWPWRGEHAALALSIAAPAILCAALAFRAVGKRYWRIEVTALLLNVLVLVVLLPRPAWAEYYATGRSTTGVLLAALLCVPTFNRLLSGKTEWLWVASVLWFLPWWQFFPWGLAWIGPSF